MLNELWAAEEAQAAAVISKVRCSFLLPSTQPSPIPEESEGPFSPATPVAAETPKGKPDVPESASGGAAASSSARAAATPDVGARPPADGAEPSPAPSDPSQAASAASAAIEQLRVVKAALAESEEARRLSEAARRDLKRQMEKAMLEHEDEIEALKQELAEQRLKQPPPPPPPPASNRPPQAADSRRWPSRPSGPACERGAL